MDEAGQRRPILHPLSVRLYLGAGLAITAIMVATRWPLRSIYLFSWDAANFAQALDAFNVAFHRPQPPGYPLYVAAAWVLRNVVQDANTAFVLLGLMASTVAAVLLLGLSWRLYGGQVAALATALFIASPNTWGHGEVAYPYAFLALGATSVAWCAVETRLGGRNLTLVGAIALGIGGGFRPDLVVLLLPLWLFGSYRRGWKWLVAGTLALVLLVLSWLVPTIQLSGGWAAYTQTLAAYSDVWATPVDAGLSGFLVGIGRNVAELARFAARSLGPVWALFLLFATGRLLSPRALARDSRIQLLAIWIMPPLLFYTLVHIGNLGYLLSVLPAVAIAGALAAREFATELVALAPRLVRRGAWTGALSGGLVALSCVAEVGLFLFSRGPVSLAEIRHVDASLSAKVAYLSALPPTTTFVLSYDRFAQFAYYLPELRRLGHLRSLENILGPDTNALNRQSLSTPSGIERVVLVDLNSDHADRPRGLQRVDLGPGLWVFSGQVQPGDHLRIGYDYARVVMAENAPATGQPAGQR